MTASPAEPPQEIEIKLAFRTAAEQERLAKALAPAAREVQQENLFLDTRDRRLSRNRWALRFRREVEVGSPRPPTVLITVKGPAQEIAGAVKRTEVEQSVPAALWTLAQEPPVRWQQLSSLPLEFLRQTLTPPPADDLPLVHLVAFTNRRRCYLLELGGGPRELVLDSTRFGTGEQAWELEVELEVEQGRALAATVQRVEADLTRLLADQGIPAEPSPASKLARALHFAGLSG